MTSVETSTAIAARHAEVLGKPQRVPMPPRESVGEAVHKATALLRGNVVGDAAPLPLEAIPAIMFTMAPFERMWNRLIDVTIAIQGPDSRLPLRDRKLAILRTGWLCQAPYEWGEHVAQSKRAGITSAEIERIIAGSTDPDWTAHERAILAAVEELHADAMIGDATWDVLARTYDDEQLVELLVLIGQFTATAYFQNSLRLRLERGNQGLVAR